jgi:regulator of sigma E protease
VLWVDDNSPAAKAGIKEHDRLLSIENGQSSADLHTEALSDATKSSAGQVVTLHFERAGQPQAVQLTLLSNAAVDASSKTDHPVGHLGVSEFTLTRSTWSAPITAAGLIGQFTVATVQGLGTAVSAVFHGDGSKAAAQVSGPVGIVVLLQEGSKLGYQFMLFIIAILSLTLSIMNVLPIPALDGGRLYMVLLSRVFGKKLSRRAEEWIVGGSFLGLLALIILITIVDVKRFF